MPLPTATQKFFLAAFEETSHLVHPLLLAGRNPIALYRLLHQIGWDFDRIFGLDTQLLLQDFHQIEQTASAIFQAINEPEKTTVVQVAHTRFKELIGRIEGLYPRFMGLDVAGTLDSISLDHAKALGQDIAEYLLLSYLVRRAPLAYSLGKLFGLIVVSPAPVIYPGNDPAQTPVRYPLERPAINWKGLLSPHTNPLAALLYQIDFTAITSLETLLDQVQLLFENWMKELYRTVGSRGLDGMTVRLDAGGLSLLGGGWLPFPESGDPPIVVQLSEPGSPQLRIEQEGYHFAWLPDIAGPDGSVVIFSQDWVKLTLLPALESNGQFTSPGLYLYENDERALTFEMVGGIGIEFPLDMLVNEAGNKVGAGARGRLVVSAGTSPGLMIDEMMISGAFRFGGPEGLAIVEAELTVEGIELPLAAPGSFPFGIRLSGTMVLPDTQGRISVALAFNKEQVYFSSTGELHLGNGIWLQPIAPDRPILEMTASQSGEYSFSVAALFKIPQEGAGVAAVELSGALHLKVGTDGVIQVKSFSAASVAANLDWMLPGQITLENAGVWIEYAEAAKVFKAGVSGGFSLTESDASMELSLELLFPNPEDPTDIEIQSKLDIEKLVILGQIYLFEVEAEMYVWTQSDGGALSPSGYIEIVEATGGFFAKDSLPGRPLPAHFHLVIHELQSMLRFQTTGFELELTDGELLLPELFTASSNSTDTRAGISVGGEQPLSIMYDRGIGLSFSGSLTVSQIGFVLETFTSDPKPGVYIETAQLLLPSVAIQATAADISLPGLQQASGRVVIPVKEDAILNFGFTAFSWDLFGIPQGMIYLAGNTDIPLGGGFVLTFVGETPTSTGLSLFYSNGLIDLEIMATMRLTLPVDMITNVDGDTIAMEAGGKMQWSNDQSYPKFFDLSLAFIGNFHIGGAEGLMVEEGRIEAVAIENMLAPSETHPFEIVISGTLSLPNGPKGGLENASFKFTGAPLPRFDLEGITGGTGNMNIAGGYLPLDIKELRLRFKPDLELPEKLYPINITAIVDAELNIGDVLSGAVEELEIHFTEEGVPQLSIDSFLVAVDGLEMGSFVLGGGMGIGGLNDIPDSLVIAGNLEGNFNGTAIQALAAFGMVEGIPAPLGAALGVQIGGAGIPLWASGFLLTGAKGGISFTGGNADPDDLKNYIIIDDNTGSIDSQPRPEPEEAADVDPEQQGQTARAEAAPAGAALEFQCPEEPCPPPSVGILYEPHPDAENYPNRIIVKFTSLQKSVVDQLLDQAGLSPAQLQAMTPEAISTRLSDEVVGLFLATLPFLSSQIEELIRNPIKELFKGAVERALDGGGSVYEVLLKEAYKGIRAPNVTVKLTGIVSYTGISSFLAVEGGVVISPTVQSAGIVGNVLLLGIPVGRLRGFLTLNNELGMIDPALCGDLAFSLGPLDLGYLRLTYKYGIDLANLSSAILDQIQHISTPMLEVALQAVDPVLFNSVGRDTAATLTNMATEQLLALVARLMQQDFTTEIRDFLLGLFDASWDNYNPQFLLCGSAQPKLFGLALDGELVGISAMADKTSFAANFRFSPIGLLSKCFYNIIPAIDQMSCSVRMELPDPRPLIASGLSASFGTEGMAGYLQEAVLHVINNAQATVEYEIAPMGLKMANAEARMLMPYLQAHPAHPDSTWKRPEDRTAAYPSRIQVLMAALDDDKLGNIFWKGSNEELKALPGLSGSNLGNLELQKDYFPHGGMMGSGRLMLPRIMLDAPPVDLFNQLLAGTVLQKFQVAMQLLQDYILTTRSVGQLAFYIPAPNPPVGAMDQISDLHHLLEQVRANDFDLEQIGVPELYPVAEIFLKGFLGTPGEPFSLLGIPLGSASVELVPPESGTEGHFRIEAEVPAGSWLSAFVEEAKLDFTIRQRPPQPIDSYFRQLQDQLNSSRRKSAVINQLIQALQSDLPKVSLLFSINNLQLPASLEPILDINAQLTGELHAYSILYDYKANFNKTGILDRARNYGGVVLMVNGNLGIGQQFGLTIKSAKTELGLFPDPSGFPAIRAHISVRSVGLPAGLPSMHQVTIELQTQSGGVVPLLPTGALSITGTVQGQTLALEWIQNGAIYYLSGDVSLKYAIKGKIGPIYEPVSGTKLLDSLVLNTHYKGNFDFYLHPSQGKITVSQGNFAWNGQSWEMPTFSISIGQSPLNWSQLLLQKIREQAYEIFAALYKNADTWLEGLRSGAFTLKDHTAANIAAILKGLGADLAKTSRLLATLFNDLTAVIEALAKQFNASMMDILLVLRQAGFTNTQQVADAVWSLYKGKYLPELVTLFKDHWSSWNNPLHTIMSHLMAAGFSLEAVIKAIKDAFGNDKLNEITAAARNAVGSALPQLKEIALALKNVWGGTTGHLNNITVALKKAWGSTTTHLDNITKALKYAWGGTDASLNKIAVALKKAWGNSTSHMNNIAKALKAAWGSNKYLEIIKALKIAWAGTSNLIDLIANVLKNYFNLTAGQVMTALKNAGFGSYEVARVMKTKFNAGAKTVASFLQNSWSKTAVDIAKRLRDAGYQVKDIVGALKTMVNSVTTMANILKAHFSLEFNTIMDALKHAGYGSYEVAKVMKSVFGASATTVARYLKDHWAKGSSQIARRLRDAGYASRYVANALENLGYSITTVANILHTEFDIGHKTVMTALKYAGYSSSEVTKAMLTIFKASATTVARFLKDEWGKTEGAILSLMTNAGYAYATVLNVLRGLFN